MHLRKAHAPAREISATEAAGLVQSGMWLDYAIGLCQPDVFDQAVGLRIKDLHDVKFRNSLTVKPRAILECDPTGEHVYGFSTHFTGYDRKMHDAGRMGYIPVNLGEIPDYYRRFIDPCDILIIKVSPLDADGYFGFGGTHVWHRAIIERAKLVIVEVSEALPWVYSEGGGIHISEVDYILQGDNAPLTALPATPMSAVDRAVAGYIAGEIGDGACIQVGIGGMPSAVCTALVESGVRNLGVHTEMLNDGIFSLYQAGLVTGSAKKLYPGKVAYSFVLGSAALYKAIERNPDFLACAVENINTPSVVMQNSHVVAINNTTQMDLQGQAASESDGHRHISGTGGQLQFVRGAYASAGGKSFICLASTYEKRGERKSRIVFDLTKGNIVTTPRSDMMYVVTEYGMVNLKGKSVAERARALIGLAHPDFRNDLERQAHEARIIPRGFTF